MISVIIPTHNDTAYLSEALDSAFSQEGVSVEVILVDDATEDRDKIEELCKPYGEQYGDRFCYIRNDTNLGVAKSRNLGVEHAHGEYVAFLDADDIWESGKLAAQLAALRENTSVLCSTARRLIAADGSRTDRIIGVPERITYEGILHSNVISCSSVMLLRKTALQYPMEHDEAHEDYLCWLRILKNEGDGVGVDTPYLLSRMARGGKSRNKFKSARMHYRTLRLAGIGAPRACLLFVSYAFAGVRKYTGHLKTGKTV